MWNEGAESGLGQSRICRSKYRCYSVTIFTICDSDADVGDTDVADADGTHVAAADADGTDVAAADADVADYYGGMIGGKRLSFLPVFFFLTRCFDSPFLTAPCELPYRTSWESS